MKIICVDNYGDETKSDILICTNINKNYGNVIIDYLNQKEHSNYFFELVEDDYKLYDASIIY